MCWTDIKGNLALIGTSPACSPLLRHCLVYHERISKPIFLIDMLNSLGLHEILADAAETGDFWSPRLADSRGLQCGGLEWVTLWVQSMTNDDYMTAVVGTDAG